MQNVSNEIMPDLTESKMNGYRVTGQVNRKGSKQVFGLKLHDPSKITRKLRLGQFELPGNMLTTLKERKYYISCWKNTL